MLDVLQVSTSRDVLQNLSRRRPRFTRSEILALNFLVNADGEAVTVGELAHEVDMMESAVIQLIYRIRSKLGEDVGHPKLITAASWKDERGVFWKAWRFNEPE